MNIRDIDWGYDKPRIKELYDRQGFEYDLPDISHPSFVVRKAVVDETGNPVAYVVIRKTAEAFLLLDGDYGSPRWRLETLRLLEQEIVPIMKGMDFTDVHAWIPPILERAFGRRLNRIFGWVKQMWPCYMKEL